MLLLTVIYLAFISLGIPDSMLGAAWPAIYQDLSIPVTYISAVSGLVTVCTIISSFFSGKILNRYGTYRVVECSVILTAAALSGFSLSKSLVCLFILTVPLGLGAGAIDTALNDYVVQHYSAKVLNFLHCFYGVGITISPYILSLFLYSNGGWRYGYRAMSAVQGIIAFIVLISYPLWDRKKCRNEDDDGIRAPQNISFRCAFRQHLAKSVFFTFFAANALESVCTVWASTVFYGIQSSSVSQAAEAVTFYFAGLALGRFLSGILSKRISGIKMILIFPLTIPMGVLTFFIRVPVYLMRIGLLLIGVGIGPLHPNLLRLTPQLFGEESSKVMMGYEIASAYTAVLLTPILFGMINKWFGIGAFAPFITTVFAAYMILLWSINKAFLKKMKRVKM